jgi:hypothetical protein
VFCCEHNLDIPCVYDVRGDSYTFINFGSVSWKDNTLYFKPIESVGYININITITDDGTIVNS